MIWSNPYVLGSPIPICWPKDTFYDAWWKLKWIYSGVALEVLLLCVAGNTV
jgi:hypothetical protein